MATVTLADYGMTFNKEAVDYFKGVQNIVIGLDLENKIVIIKPSEDENHNI